LSSLSAQNVAAKQPDALETAASQLFASGFRGAILAARAAIKFAAKQRRLW
jgi:hypothetical protein